MLTRTFQSAHPLVAGLAVVGLAAAVSHLTPERHAATAVGVTFLLATYLLVMRLEDERVQHHGLALGGLLERKPLSARRILRDFARALGWSVGVSSIVLPPFVGGFLLWYEPARDFSWQPVLGSVDDVGPALDLLDLYLGHFLVIALPEEAFFRGYLQTRLDDRFGVPLRLLGARLGWGLLVSSLLFSVGHVLTLPFADRLAVFFPSLLFGWLRNRTGGIGAPVLLHAHCNICVAVLQRGFGFH